MTVRDIETIAACLKNAPIGGDAAADRANVANAIALELELDQTPGFNRALFLALADVDQDRT